MAAHWSDGYVGIPHERLDCGELVQLVLREQFNRMVHFPQKERLDVFHRAGLITKHCADFARPISEPFDGCGVMMFSRGRMAHIGLYCVIDQPYILHSDSMFGESVRFPLTRVAQTHRIQGFYAWLD